ncbi:MAG: ABC transporter permease, partial [Bacteroidota bacterium]
MAARKNNPPQVAERFLAWFCTSKYFEEIHGDLAELFEDDAVTKGRARARLRYFFRVLSFLKPRYFKTSIGSLKIGIILNHFLIARRSLAKYRQYTLFSLFCLVIGLSSGVLMIAYVLDELSYDTFLPEHELVFRVAQHVDMETSAMDAAITPGPLGAAMVGDFPEVQAHAIVSIFNRFTFEVDDQKFSEPHSHFVNEDFLKVFNYDLLAGNPTEVFARPKSMLVTQSFADNLFGTDDVLNRDIAVAGRGTFTITGVMRDIPSNSHFHPKALLYMGDDAVSFGWLDHSFYTYIKLKQAKDQGPLSEKLPAFHDRVLKEPLKESFEGTGHIYLQPINDIHLHSDLDFELESNGSYTTVLSLGGLALFIIIVVCINYLNITSAQATRRIREVGVRKVLGSTRGMLRAQFYIESFLLCYGAGLLALLIAAGALPLFNEVSGKHVAAEALVSLQLLGIYLGILSVLALVSGSYAALFLSSFRIDEALRNKITFSRLKLPISKVLNSFQFVVSLVMIIMTIAVYQQIEYAQQLKLGFDQSQLLKIELTNRIGPERMQALSDELLSHSQITAVTTSMKSPGDDFWADGLFFEREDSSFASLKTEYNAVDERFVSTLGLQLLAGRDFGLLTSDREGRAVLVNEQVVKDLGYTNNEDILGREVKLPLGKDHRAKIVGVTADAHMRSLHHRVGPQILFNFPNITTQLLVKLENGASTELLTYIDEKVEAMTNSNTHQTAFLDQHYWAQYEGEQRRSKLFTIFSLLTVILAFTGLTALVSFEVRLQAKAL